MSTMRMIGWSVGVWLRVGSVLAQHVAVPPPASAPADVQVQAVQIAPSGEPARPPAPPPASGEHYAIRVKTDDVNLRTRPDTNALIVARLRAGTVLDAVALDFGWYKVLPPPGVFSLVSAQHVQQRGDGTGVVMTESGNLRVRAGSLESSVDPLRSDVQMLLSPGAVVRVLGQEGEWLKIASPEGVQFYVSAEFVERVDAAGVSAARAAAPPVGAAPGRSTPAIRPLDAGATPASVTETPLVAMSQPAQESPRVRFEALELQMRSESTKPALEQVWEPYLPQLQSLVSQTVDPPVARAATEWITRINAQRANQAALRAARQIAQRDDQERARLRSELEQMEAARLQTASAPYFAARGVLEPSLALPAGPSGLRYVLRNPVTRRVEAYCEFPMAVPFDRSALVGKYVGVRGQKRFESAVGMDLITATDVTVLDSTGVLAPPARGP